MDLIYFWSSFILIILKVFLYGRIIVFIDIQMTSSLILQIFQRVITLPIYNIKLYNDQVISLLLYCLGQ